MNLNSQLDKYIQNIFKYLNLEDELGSETIQQIRNSVLLSAFDQVIKTKYNDYDRKNIQAIIEKQNQEALEKLIIEDDLEGELKTQIQKQFIEIVGELLIDLNKDDYISDEKIEKLIEDLQDPDKQQKLFSLPLST